MGTSGLGQGALDVKNEGEDIGSSLFRFTATLVSILYDNTLGNFVEGLELEELYLGAAMSSGVIGLLWETVQSSMSARCP